MIWIREERGGEESGGVALRRKCWNPGWYYLSWREGRGHTGRDTSQSLLSVWRKCCPYHDIMQCDNNTHTTHSNIFKKCSAKCLSLYVIGQVRMWGQNDRPGHKAQSVTWLLSKALSGSLLSLCSLLTINCNYQSWMFWKIDKTFIIMNSIICGF